MEQIRNYPCLCNKSKMSYKKRNVNRNAWSKSEEKLRFMQNVIYKYRHKKLSDCFVPPVAKNRRVKARSSRPEVFCKKVFLEISQNSHENTCVRVSFIIK